MKILFIKLGALGGVLRATPLFTGIKEKYKDCTLHILTKEAAKELIQNNDDIDKIYIWENDKDKIYKEKYDWVINTEDDRETCDFVSKLKKEKLTGPFTNNDKIEYTKDSSPIYDMGKISKFGLQKANQLKKDNKGSYQSLYSKILDLPRDDYLIKLNLTDSQKRI